MVSMFGAPPRAVALSCVIASVSLFSGCNRQAPPAGGPPGGAMPPMAVTLLTAEPRQVPVTIDVVATLEGLREVEVRSRVTGTLQQQLYKDGETVKAGTPMFRIDRAPFEITVDSARAAVAQAEARAEQARRETTRLAALVADRAISQREADDAATGARTADAALLAARTAARRSAEPGLRRDQRAHCRHRAARTAQRGLAGVAVCRQRPADHHRAD